MDRMDYLNRDSYFTGVSEGVIGYDRIIKMLNVVESKLVVEEKGIYSIEKFLIARRFMYWQVYLHKTVLVAEQMLIKTLQRAKFLTKNNEKFFLNENLEVLLHPNLEKSDFVDIERLITSYFVKLDDIDIINALKEFQKSKDTILALLAKSILERKLFKIDIYPEPIRIEYVKDKKTHLMTKLSLSEDDASYLVFIGNESNRVYSNTKDEINILCKDGSVRPISELSDFTIQTNNTIKHYCIYPKFLKT
jgi:hypothetical protein